jgi:vacuolar-type H+-ATPase subunit H
LTQNVFAIKISWHFFYKLNSAASSNQSTTLNPIHQIIEAEQKAEQALSEAKQNADIITNTAKNSATADAEAMLEAERKKANAALQQKKVEVQQEYAKLCAQTDSEVEQLLTKARANKGAAVDLVVTEFTNMFGAK